MREKRPGVTYYGLDIPDEIYQFLIEQAAREDRPLARLIRRVLKEWVDRHPDHEPSDQTQG